MFRNVDECLVLFMSFFDGEILLLEYRLVGYFGQREGHDGLGVTASGFGLEIGQVTQADAGEDGG